MSHDRGPIERFVASVRSRLNWHCLWTTLIWTVAAAATVLVVLGLWYTLRGYAVPTTAIVGTLLVAAAAGLSAWRLRLFSEDAAARAADQFYRLHDALSSYLHFSRAGRGDGYYALQAAQTHERVAPLDPQQMKYQPPRRGIALAACLVAIAVPLGMLGPSEAVLQEQRLQAETAEATVVINEELAKLVEELREEAADGEEKELLEPNKLRQWVDELSQTNDHKDALRQYAQLERKLNEARLAVQNKRDEQLLNRAARELETSRETQPLADELKQKNYDGAGEQLSKMAPQKSSQPLDKQRKELARLKAAAQHMAAAAKAARTASTSAKSSTSAKPSQSQSAASNASAGANSDNASGASGASSDGGEMAQTMEDLANAVKDFDEALDDAQRQESQQGQCDADKLAKCEACSAGVAAQLDKLNQGLKKLAMCRRTDARLAKLCKMCSQCQGGLCQAAALCQSPNAGGKKAGWGSSETRRDQIDDLIDNGQTTQLKGIKGPGPSLTAVEAAEEGSGVSTRQAANRERAFQRQFESFVAREDVPEQVKRGVKHYFEVIHQIQPEQTSEEAPGDDGDGN